jgi:hypothetical protein
MLKKGAVRIVQVTLVGALAVLSISSRNAQIISTSPKPISLDESHLSLTKQRLAVGDASLKPAFDALKTNADAALKKAADSVTRKDLTPPSGNKQDYMSMGPYWWPNPNTPDGLPYVRKDGQTNPATRGNGLDSVRLQSMNSAVRDLSLAYYFTGDKAYATKTAEILRVWFLDPQTRMNPNLRYAQAIPGVVDGRGIGLIDSRNMWMVIDAVALIAPSGEFNEAEVRGMRAWFANLVNWMLTSETGHEEDVWHNNHGIFFDAQVINFLLFTGDFTQARQRIFDAQTKRIASQIARDGRQHMELERTRPFHYSTFNLEAALRIARYGEQINTLESALKADDPRCVHPQPRCAIDVWQFEVDERSLKRGIDFVTAVAADPKSWTLFTEEEKALNFNPVVPILLMAERAYKTGTYEKVLATLPGSTATALERLLWPIKK